MLRYDYQQRHVSASAIEFARSHAHRRVPVLLAYAQKNIAYTRGENKSLIPDGEYDTVFVATRLAEMVNVATEADTYYFDFEVRGYPNQSNSLSDIITPLVATHEVPWEKWVALSTRVDSLESLKAGDASGNWSEIIRKIGNPPMQFSDDAYWRLSGPFSLQGKPIQVSLERITSQGSMAQVRSFYPIRDHEQTRFFLSSATAGQIPPTRPEYEVRAESSDSKVLKIAGSGIYELRHHTTQPVDLLPESVPPLSTRMADIHFATHPDGPWPKGASLALRFLARKSYLSQAIGIVCGLAGVVGGIIAASKLFEYDVLNGVYIAIASALLIVLSSFVLTGKLQFKS